MTHIIIVSVITAIFVIMFLLTFMIGWSAREDSGSAMPLASLAVIPMGIITCIVGLILWWVC